MSETIRVYRFLLLAVVIAAACMATDARAQGNKVSIQVSPPKALSVCGLNDTASIQVFNISSGTITGVTVTLSLPPGVLYIAGTVKGTGVTENNISNLNKPVFNGPSLNVAKNFQFRVTLSANCNLLSYLAGNNVPVVTARTDYVGNYDVGSSIPFSVKVPSVQFVSITNQSATGNINDKFGRTITFGNYGSGPLTVIRLTRINGKDVKTYKINGGGVTLFKGDTTVTTFSGKDFKAVGNLDTFLDQNEIVSIIDSSQILGCKTLNTTYELSWGCSNIICQTVKNSGVVLISNQSPNLVAFASAVYPTCYNNGSAGVHSIKVTNNGSLPAIASRINVDQGYFYMFSQIDTASIRVKKGWKGTLNKAVTDSTGGSYHLGAYSCVGANPIGSFRVLLGTINTGDTFYVTWKTTSCLPPGCNNNYYLNGWYYYGDYQDQCKNKKLLNTAWAKYYDYNILTATAFTPTDLINGQKGAFRHTLSGTSFLTRDASASYLLDIVLPPGLTHSLSSADLFFNNANLSATWKPDSIRQRGDTVRAYFHHPVPFDLSNGELIYYLTADCSISGANGSKTVQTIFRYTPNATCKPAEWIYMMCSNVAIKIHCGNQCNGGMKFVNFTVGRTSFGQPDNNNDGLPDGSGSLNMANVRAERAMTGDTITTVFYGAPKRTSSIIRWRYAYARSAVTYGSYLDVISAEVIVRRNNKNTSSGCTNVRYKKTISGLDATFTFDFTTDSIASCLPAGFYYSQGDSVKLIVKYKLVSNIGGTSLTSVFKNDYYFSDVANPVYAPNIFQCDTFSGQEILTGYYYSNWGAGTYNINSCNSINLNNYFYLGIGPCCNNYGGNNYFPYEYRNFARLKGVNLYLPKGFRLLNSQVGQYRTAGSNQTIFQYKDSIQPTKTGTYPLRYETSKYYTDSAKGKINLSDDGFHGYFNATVEPTCELPANTNIPIQYDFIYERKGTLGKGYDTVTSLSTSNNDMVNFSKPVISAKPVIPVLYAAQDTAEWEISYTNSSSTFNTLNAWFYPDNAGSVKIIDIRDAAKDTSLKQSNQIYKAGTMPLSTTRRFKVRAIYNSCRKDSIVLYTGWNCNGYPKDFASYQCSPDKIVLYLEPQNTQFQFSIADSIKTADLCAKTPYTVKLENIGATTAYNTKVQLTLPLGMTVVPGSVYLKYPVKSGWSALSNPTLLSGTTYEWDLSKLSAAIGKGFKGVSDTLKNKLLLKFLVKTGCDYSSGNYLRVGGSANIKCGDPVAIYPAISDPLNITGVTRPYYSLLKVSSDSIFPCEKPTAVQVKIINLGPAKTGIEDKYQAMLLQGMNYDSLLFTAVRNAPDNTLTKHRDINGATEVEYSLPKDIAPGDSIEFTMGYHSDTRFLHCGQVDFYSQAAVKQEVTCVADNSKCKINVVTGNTLVKPEVVKGSFQLSGFTSVIQNMDSVNETIAVNLSLKNTGKTVLQSSPIVLAYYYDRNNSGSIDAGDTKVHADTLKKDLKNNGTLVISDILKIAAGQSCALFVTIDSASCSCSFGQYKIPVPPLKNAGADIAFCTGSKVSLKAINVKTFRYQWTPAAELSNDTIPAPAITYNNTGSIKEKHNYILTTYRGYCTTRDTVTATIYPLPGITMLQGDTLVCSGNPVTLNARVQGGTGKINSEWKPAVYLADSSKLKTVCTPVSGKHYILQVKDSFGCVASDSVKITAKPYPKAWFTFSNACENSLVLIKDSSVITEDSILSYRWQQQSFDTLNVKQWTLLLQGTLQAKVRLIVNSPYKCQNIVDRIVSVNPNPVAAFTSVPVCDGDSVYFKDSSVIASGNITGRLWQFGDNGISIYKDPAHLYTKADTFNVTLQLTSNKNCRDTFVSKAIVHPMPRADFSVPEVCQGNSSVFTNLSKIKDDSIARNDWYFDNTGSSSLQSPIWLFNQDGTYSVTLRTTSANGCSNSIAKDAVVNPLPKADFSINAVCEGQPSLFNDNSVISAGKINSWLWQLQDGGTSAKQNFTHTFAYGDTFSALLKIASLKGCKDSILRQAIVHPRLKPAIRVSDECIGDTLHFFDNTTGKNTVAVSWQWHFTTNDSSSLKEPKHVYPVWGNYKVLLRTTSSDGCIYDTFKFVTVYPKPVITFGDTNKCFDNQFRFDDSIRIASGSVQSVSWNFGDGTFSGIQDPPHRFPAAGSYRVVLKATSDFGCTDSLSKQIQSYPPVIVDFSSQDVCLGYPVQFTDKSILPNATIKNYDWQFGDGNTSNLPNPLHLYKNNGTYNVSLGITTSYNCYYDTAKNLVIFPVPVAGFNTDPDIGTILDPSISFTDASSGATGTWYDLGDSTTETLPDFTHNYPDSGNYTVVQKVVNQFGCRDSVSKTVIIRYLFTFYIPTVFTPNEDLINDLFGPQGIGVTQYDMSIYNRWGDLVYHTDTGKPWDGTYMGQLCPDGVYAVTFKIRDFNRRLHYVKHTVTLLR